MKKYSLHRTPEHAALFTEVRAAQTVFADRG